MKFKINFLLIIILSLFFQINIVLSQDVSCPYGRVYDEYPGDCNRYIDTNSNNYCDLSEPKDEVKKVETGVIENLITNEEFKTKTIAQVANLYNIDSEIYTHQIRDYYKLNNVEPSTSFQILSDKYGVDILVAKDILNSIKNNLKIPSRIAQTEFKKDESIFKTPKYPFILLVLFLFLIYLFTFSLSKAKQIKYITHLRFWNIILLISFLITGITGILLILRINYNFVIKFPFDILYWHVEIGIIMAIVSILHILNHIKYFKIMFKKTKK